MVFNVHVEEFTHEYIEEKFDFSVPGPDRVACNAVLPGTLVWVTWKDYRGGEPSAGLIISNTNDSITIWWFEY